MTKKRNKIGCKIKRIFDHIHVKRCHKWWNYNHTGESCTDDSTWSKCAGTHNIMGYKSDVQQCSNRDYPCYQRLLNSIKNKAVHNQKQRKKGQKFYNIYIKNVHSIV